MTTKNTQQAPRHKIKPISAAIKNELEPASPSVPLPKPRKKTTYIPIPLPAEGYVRRPSVLAVLGISNSAYNNGVKAGIYPAGKLLSPRCRVYSVVEIRALLASLEASGETEAVRGV